MVKRCLFTIILTLFMCSSAYGMTVCEYLESEHPDMDEVAVAVLKPLGTMSTWEKLFIDRLATLSEKSQRSLAAKLAIDGRITKEDLASLPVKISIPEDPAQIIALLTEHTREDYWPGFYRRHKLAVDMKMRHWDDTAERRYDDPQFCQRLIDIFFQLKKGTYDGPMELEYYPTQQDNYSPAD